MGSIANTLFLEDACSTASLAGMVETRAPMSMGERRPWAGNAQQLRGHRCLSIPGGQPNIELSQLINKFNGEAYQARSANMRQSTSG